MQIKKGLEGQYQEYVDKNNDPYGGQCVKSGEKVGALLDAGKTGAEAIKGLDGDGLTGYMAGAAIAGVVFFNPRGEELKKAWNIYCGGTGEEKGAINPAIVTIG